MSGKGSKRRQRRINTTEEEAEKKVEDVIEISDDSKSTISIDTEKTDKDSSLKDLKDLKEIKEDKEETKKENGEKVEPIENGQSDEDPSTTALTGTPPPEAEAPATQPSENGTSATTTEPQTSQEDNTSDIEPLVLDSEDPELQFPSETGSETSEIEKSPVLNRCKTRRSQTRNLPTPKTPKSLDYNGEEDKNSKELRVNIARLQPTPEVIIEEIETSENVSIVSNESSISENTKDTDLTNASVFVNIGDTTRNINITTTSSIHDDSTVNVSSFIDLTKDKSYGETLRCLTGRKTLRSNYLSSFKPRFYQSSIDLTDSSKTYSPIQSGMKRKLEQDSPGEIKKSKTDPSPGLFSYIASPFKSTVNRTEIPSSTPKLTSFKFVHQGSNQIDEVKKIGIELEDKKAEAKKWCTVM